MDQEKQEDGAQKEQAAAEDAVGAAVAQTALPLGEDGKCTQSIRCQLCNSLILSALVPTFTEREVCVL